MYNAFIVPYVILSDGIFLNQKFLPYQELLSEINYTDLYSTRCYDMIIIVLTELSDWNVSNKECYS